MNWTEDEVRLLPLEQIDERLHRYHRARGPMNVLDRRFSLFVKLSLVRLVFNRSTEKGRGSLNRHGS